MPSVFCGSNISKLYLKYLNRKHPRLRRKGCRSPPDLRLGSRSSCAIWWSDSQWLHVEMHRPRGISLAVFDVPWKCKFMLWKCAGGLAPWSMLFYAAWRAMAQASPHAAVPVGITRGCFAGDGQEKKRQWRRQEKEERQRQKEEERQR